MPHSIICMHQRSLSTVCLSYFYTQLTQAWIWILIYCPSRGGLMLDFPHSCTLFHPLLMMMIGSGPSQAPWRWSNLNQPKGVFLRRSVEEVIALLYIIHGWRSCFFMEGAHSEQKTKVNQWFMLFTSSRHNHWVLLIYRWQFLSVSVRSVRPVKEGINASSLPIIQRFKCSFPPIKVLVLVWVFRAVNEYN